MCDHEEEEEVGWCEFIFRRVTMLMIMRLLDR